MSPSTLTCRRAGSCALWVRTSTRRAGKAGMVHVVCHDINETVRKLIRSGAVDFTIPQDLDRQGYVPPLLLRDHLRKKKPLEPGQFQGQINILCAENL